MPALPTIWQPAKVATPPAGVWGLALQVRVAPLPGWLAMPKVTGLVAVVTTLPPLSSTLTAGWVVQVAPLAPPLGWVLKASCAAAPTVMLNDVLVVLNPAPVALRV